MPHVLYLVGKDHVLNLSHFLLTGLLESRYTCRGIKTNASDHPDDAEYTHLHQLDYLLKNTHSFNYYRIMDFWEYIHGCQFAKHWYIRLRAQTLKFRDHFSKLSSIWLLQVIYSPWFNTVIITMKIIIPSSEGYFVCMCELQIYLENASRAFSAVLAYNKS